ncbi:MAG TPA: HlyD family efflux transporter periplasmic adaptor subunit [Blastocatellia bacterium]|nr:HlyD family efflux transporter periplasmic adaptor subunit [Blastocatellia bacterium]
MAAHPPRLWDDAQRRRVWFVCSLVLLSLIAVISFRSRALLAGRLASIVAELPAARAESTLPTAQVRRGEVRKTLLLDGELRAVRSRTIFANMSDDAKITWLPPEGSLVKAGDRLVELDNTAILSKIKDVEERIVAAENEIDRTSSQHESQLRDLEVQLSQFWLELEKAKVEARVPAGIVARREYQDKQFALEKAKTEYENQLAKIEQKKKEFAAELQVKVIEKHKAERQLEKAQGDLNGMMIKAPTDGMVLYTDHWNERRKIQVGDVVWGGLPVVSLPDMNEMEVMAQVNEVDGPKISVGNKAGIRLDSYPDTEITGTVKEISQTAAKAGWMSKTKVFTVIISMDKTVPEVMKPGMSSQVAIVVGESGEQLLVPRAAMKFDGTSTTVERVEGEKNRRTVAVTIVSSDSINYALAANGALREGDRIIERGGSQ